MSSLQGHGRIIGWSRVNIQLDDDGISAGGPRSHTEPSLKCVCVPVCLCMLTFNFHSVTTHNPPPQRLHLSLCSRGQYVPLSQVILQRVEDAELLFRLKHQQLLQQLARVRAPARQRLNI